MYNTNEDVVLVYVSSNMLDVFHIPLICVERKTWVNAYSNGFGLRFYLMIETSFEASAEASLRFRNSFPEEEAGRISYFFYHQSCCPNEAVASVRPGYAV